MNAAAGATPGRDDWDHHWAAYRAAAELNPANRFRMRLIFEALALGTGAARLVDVGSGAGELLRAASVAHPRAELLGIEMAGEGIAAAQRALPAARFLQRDLTVDAPFPADLRGWATHAVCSEVLEHIDDPALLLRNVAPVLGAGCRLIITVPGGPMSAFDRGIGHRRHFTTEALAGVIRAAGLTVDWTHGAGFPFFNLYRLAVIARGDSLAQDLKRAALPWSARAAMSTFDRLLRLSPTRGARGWQIVACARAPGGG